ncbi:GNAT family N-acetyltransferase [Pelagibius marinus]|uniref:GNAT family N-acetyltransferase n=1 Tax=Pelagibius marinus TaxID=2762760 RepID=UPI001D038544|nr:GNAT family N-acetyltransferase [Pelagibius marinus]
MQGTGGQQAPFRVRTYRSFEELPGCYAHLLDDMAKINFSFSRAWFLAFARTALQEGATLRLYGVESTHSEVQARGLFVAQTPAARRGSLLRNRHLGKRTLSGLTGYQTYLFAPLVRDEDPGYEGIFDSLAAHLRGERPQWEVIEFAAMDAEAHSYDVLMAALRRAGFAVRGYPHFLGIFEPTRGQDYDAYLTKRPASARKQIKNYERKERKLRQRNSFKWDLFTSEAGLDQALKDYNAVLEASWKEPDYHPGFLPACIRAAAQAGTLRLGIVYLDGRPAATQLVFLAGQRALFYRTAYDPAFAKVSVGAIGKLRMVQHLLNEDRPVDEFDFGRDRESFKKIWASEERTRCGIIAFNLRTPGGWRGLAEHRLFEWKDWFGEMSRPLRSKLKDLKQGHSPQHAGN